MHLLSSPDRGSELKGLGSPDEIALFVKQQQALIAQAKREEAAGPWPALACSSSRWLLPVRGELSLRRFIAGNRGTPQTRINAVANRVFDREARRIICLEMGDSNRLSAALSRQKRR